MNFLDYLRRTPRDERAALKARFLVYLEQHAPGSTCTEPQPSEFRIVSPEGEEHTVFLENLFRQIEGLSVEEREAEEAKYFEIFLSLDEPLGIDVNPSRVVALIKDQDYFAVVSNTKFLVREHLVGDLWLLYCIDLPTSIVSIMPEQVSALRLGEGGLRALAVDNLRRLCESVELHHQKDWFLLTANPAYTASALLLDAIWDQIADKVDGDLVVAAPARDVLLVTGSRNAAGLSAIRAKACEIVADGNYVISSSLMRRAGKGWTSFS